MSNEIWKHVRLYPKSAYDWNTPDIIYAAFGIDRSDAAQPETIA
jgi:hypothetical protein